MTVTENYPLHVAVWNRQVKVVQYLVEVVGANVELINWWDENAVKCGFQSIVECQTDDERKHLIPSIRVCMKIVTRDMTYRDDQAFTGAK